MTKRKRIVLVSTILLVGLSVLGLYVAKWEFRAPVFEIYFFKLNKGHSVFIRTPHGKTILIDGGQNSEIIRELTKVSPFYRRRIDIVIATNSFPKNVGGLVDVLERYEVGKVIEPAMMGTSTALDAFQKSIKRKMIKVEEVEKGDTWEIDGVTFAALFPDPDYKYNKSSLPELVLRINYGSTGALLLGEASKTIQKSFMNEIDSAYIVEFAHAAAKSRVSAELLGQLNPEYVVSSEREKTLRLEFR